MRVRMPASGPDLVSPVENRSEIGVAVVVRRIAGSWFSVVTEPELSVVTAEIAECTSAVVVLPVPYLIPSQRGVESLFHS
jgi:hypothetical protein